MPRRKRMSSNAGQGCALMVLLPFILIVDIIQRDKIKRLAVSKKKQKDRYLSSQKNLQALSPAEFEEYIAFLFRKMGYQAKLRGNTNTSDQGVDIEARRSGEYIIIQCKRYAGTVGSQEVRDLFGATIAEGANKGFLVTTGSFSRPAKKWARGKQLELAGPKQIDGWMASCKVGPYESEEEGNDQTAIKTKRTGSRKSQLIFLAFLGLIALITYAYILLLVLGLG